MKQKIEPEKAWKEFVETIFRELKLYKITEWLNRQLVKLWERIQEDEKN